MGIANGERIAPADEPSTGGLSLASPSGKWVLAVAVMGSGMVFLDGTVVNVALPRIGHDLRAPTSELQWILNGYLLTLASLILLGGSLGDRYGRRRVFRAGAALFTLASLLCSVAPSGQMLVLARLLQGIGGALLTPGSLAIIEASFQPAERARAIGAWSGLGGVATALGPLAGGYLVAAISWRAIFVVNLPLGVLVIVIAQRHVPESRDQRITGALDVGGALLAGVGLAGITYALIESPGHGSSPAVLFAAIGGVVALVAFVLAERRAANPMLPLDIFASAQFTAANLVTFVVYAALGGVFFLFVAFLQISMRYSPVQAGAASLPITALMLALSSRSGALAGRIGPRIPLTAGPLVIAAGLLLMTAIRPGDSYLTGVLPAVIVFGLGLTLVVAPVTATVLAAIDPRRSGIASGINNAVSRIAGLLAVALLPLLAGLTGRRFYDSSAMTAGFHEAMLLCAALSVFGGIVAWLTINSTALAGSSSAAPASPGLAGYRCDLAGTPLAPSTGRDGHRCDVAGKPLEPQASDGPSQRPIVRGK